MLAEAALSGRILSSETFRDDIARLKAARAALLATYPPQEGTRFAIFHYTGGRSDLELWLHPIPRKTGGWRITTRTTDPTWAHTPFLGHTEHDTYEAAIKELLRDRAVFVSRNVEPVMHDPSEGFRNTPDAELLALAERTRNDLAVDRTRQGWNAILYSTLLFAVENEIRKRGLA